MQENVPLSGYTAARIGGPADALVFVRKADELAQAAEKLWKMEMPFRVLGGGSNVLVSDQGVRGVVIINRARLLKFNSKADLPTVHAETGVTPNDIAQRAARLGLSGFEWAASVPGSLGGAIYGNAGAFGGDMAGSLISVELIHRQHGRQGHGHGLVGLAFIVAGNGLELFPQQSTLRIPFVDGDLRAADGRGSDLSVGTCLDAGQPDLDGFAALLATREGCDRDGDGQQGLEVLHALKDMRETVAPGKAATSIFWNLRAGYLSREWNFP